MVDSRMETEKKCKMNPGFLFGPESRRLLENYGICQQTQEPVRRVPHWSNLGQFEH